jgi:hypothetical protein
MPSLCTRRRTRTQHGYLPNPSYRPEHGHRALLLLPLAATTHTLVLLILLLLLLLLLLALLPLVVSLLHVARWRWRGRPVVGSGPGQHSQQQQQQQQHACTHANSLLPHLQLSLDHSCSIHDNSTSTHTARHRCTAGAEQHLCMWPLALPAEASSASSSGPGAAHVPAAGAAAAAASQSAPQKPPRPHDALPGCTVRLATAQALHARPPLAPLVGPCTLLGWPSLAVLAALASARLTLLNCSIAEAGPSHAF